KEVRDREDALAGMRDACATQSISRSRLVYHRLLRKRNSSPLIARVLQNIPRANAVFPCWSCKMAEQFLSIPLTAVRRTEGGQSSVEQNASGGSRRSLRRATDSSS